MDWLLYPILFAVSVGFYIPLGVGSVEYHVWLYKPKISEFMLFYSQLHFPFSFFRGNPDNGDDERFVKNAGPIEAMVLRCFGTLVPLYSVWRLYFDRYDLGSRLEVLDLLATIAITLPILMMWKFGRGLRKYTNEKSVKE